LTSTNFSDCLDVIERFVDGQATSKEFEEATTLAAYFAYFSMFGNRDDRVAILISEWRGSPIATDPVAVLGPTVDSLEAAHGLPVAAFIRDVFGNPFRPVTFSPSWRTDTAVSLACGMYESRDFSAMPILADALQDAGCDNDDVLNHCRDEKQVHARGCWVVDLVLNK
jgi:hypothetical protein